MAKRKSIAHSLNRNVVEMTSTEAFSNLHRLCLLGLTDSQLAEYFGTSEEIWKTWVSNSPEMKKVIKEGRLEADGKVAAALFKRATGCRREIVKTVESLTDNGLEVTSITKTVEDVLPDTAAAQFWLKNKSPEQFRDKQEVEHNVSLSWADLVLESQKPKIIEHETASGASLPEGAPVTLPEADSNSAATSASTSEAAAAIDPRKGLPPLEELERFLRVGAKSENLGLQPQSQPQSQPQATSARQ